MSGLVALFRGGSKARCLIWRHARLRLCQQEGTL
jgi:hypothetical protein